MPAGRPTDYTPELLEKARKYIDGHWEMQGDAIPSIAGLAVYLKKSRETLHAWARDEAKEQFSDMLGEMLAKQENILISKGLLNEHNATITKLVLSKHGYSDRIEQDLQSSDGSMTPKAGLDVSRLSTETLAEIMAAADEEPDRD